MSSSKDELQFHDSGQDDVLYDRTDGQTHTFTNFPTSAVSDEEEEEGDKSQLLKDKKGPSFWTFEYYQQFFDVESHQVFSRVLGSMTPLPHKNYLKTNIRPNPDLYGPFWICTTLVFTTAIAGNLANYLSLGGKDYTWRYDFHKVTIAASAIFSYWWLVPGILYGVLWYRKSEAGYTFMEVLCLYGYSLAIYIPISILWVINLTWLRWVLVITGAVTSGGVLVITFWPAVRNDTKQVAYAIIGLIFMLHLLLAAGFVLYFFHVPPTTSTSPTIQTTVSPVKPQQLTEIAQQQAKPNSESLNNKPSNIKDQTLPPQKDIKTVPVTKQAAEVKAEKILDDKGLQEATNNDKIEDKKIGEKTKRQDKVTDDETDLIAAGQNNN